MNGLDHVAILVSDLDAAVKLYRDVYGLELVELEEVPTEKVRVAIFGHGAGRIELVSPTGPARASTTCASRCPISRGRWLR